MCKRQPVAVLLSLTVLAGLVRPAAGKARKYFRKQQGEVYLSNEEFKKLDRFEAHSLEKADEAFNERKYRQSLAEYESFLQEYSRSTAIPYVLLRKGRCLHLDDKRNVAIRQYNEVLDYFPDDVEYAAAALYYQGLAHWENGDEQQAMKHWAKMARDKEYRKHRLAAGAINSLADNLVKAGHAEIAVSYFWQVAVDFRSANQQAAAYARHKAEEYYLRAAPNEAKLRQLYRETQAVRAARLGEEEMAKSFEYWDKVRGKVYQYGAFTEDQAELKRTYYAYWAQRLDGKFPKEDDYQIAVAALHLAAGGDKAAWTRRIDAQFARGKQDDYGRIARWIGLFGADKSKVAEYYGKLRFEKMTNAEITALVRVLFDRVRDAKMARNAFFKLNFKKMPDGEKAGLARYLWGKDFELGRDLCMNMQDKDRGKHELLLYYHGQRDAKNGIPLADHLIGVPQYATDALWKKAELLEAEKKYPQAIDAYQRIPQPPSNLWRIATCYERMGKVDKAVGQLREVEGFFEKYRAQAALRIAQLYKRAKMQKQCVAAFRRVLTKYPDTRESSEAHHQLESMGITRIRGGVKDGKD